MRINHDTSHHILFRRKSLAGAFADDDRHGDRWLGDFAPAH